MTPRSSASDYFDQYTWQQARKHDLLKYYLGGWFPKIADLGGRALYCETHAGRGKHKSGESGSPVVALETLLSHRLRPQILAKSEIRFLFLELDESSASHLQEALKQYSLPPQVRVEVRTGDFKAVLSAAIDSLETHGKSLAPALTFMDPFGYDIPHDLIVRLLNQRSGEVLLTFMANAVARAMRDPTKVANLTRLYGPQDWQAVAQLEDFEEQKTAAIDLYERSIGARWSTSVRLTGQTDYALMHFTSHVEGRELMKRAAWSLDKTGGYQLFKTDDPQQLTLIELNPNLQMLGTGVRRGFGGRDVSYSELASWLLETDWIGSQLNKVLMDGKKAGWVETKHHGKFGPSMKERIKILGLPQ